MYDLLEQIGAAVIVIAATCAIYVDDAPKRPPGLRALVAVLVIALAIAQHFAESSVEFTQWQGLVPFLTFRSGTLGLASLLLAVGYGAIGGELARAFKHFNMASRNG